MVYQLGDISQVSDAARLEAATGPADLSHEDAQFSLVCLVLVLGWEVRGLSEPSDISAPGFVHSDGMATPENTCIVRSYLLT
jgi:hypothetical protein